MMLKIEDSSRKISLETSNLPDGDLLTLLREQNFSISAACGGRGRCGKCKVLIKNNETGDVFEANSCQTPLSSLKGDFTVTLLKTEEIFAGETSFYGSDRIDSEGDRGLALAIDVGTTTLAIGIVDTNTGGVIGSYSAINRQRRFGADVISRIEASKDSLAELHALITEDLRTGIRELLGKHSVGADQIKRTVIAGNTCMMSLLLNLDCRSMGRSPFTPPAQLKTEQEYTFSEVFGDELGIDCKVFIPPSVSSYIGADITAGILLIPEKKYETNSLFFDMGTNGEIVLFSKGRVMCASAAAGPALEGGNISCGTGGIPGAVHTVRHRDGKFEYETIGNKPPVGICGSAVIDVMSCLLDAGIVNKTGRFADKALKETGVRICDNATFTTGDVRSVQLSKSAIRAGIECLLEEAGIKDTDVDALYLAGGFGAKIDVENSVKIGLIASPLSSKVIPLGNSSLGGAVKLLCDPKATEDMRKFISKAKELELGGNESFSNGFMTYMGF